jgi:hypothetical protein
MKNEVLNSKLNKKDEKVRDNYLQRKWQNREEHIPHGMRYVRSRKKHTQNVHKQS